MKKIIYSRDVKTKVNIVGNKAEGLLFLQKYKFEIPEFYVLDFSTLKNLKEFALKKLIENWLNDNNIKKNTLWAIRSSADVEDGVKKSYAGLFLTKINIPIFELETAINEVLNAYQSIKNLNYSEDKHFKYGIIIQKMINPDYSGVIFSHNPLDLDDNSSIINIVPGAGEELVSGRSGAYSINKKASKIIYPDDNDIFQGKVFKKNIIVKGKEIKQKINILTDKLFEDSKKISELKKQPVDIEFCISEGKIYYLQVRPITAVNKKISKIISIWDNSNIGENYPDITMPLTIDFVKYTYTKAYSNMALFLGMSAKKVNANLKYFENMAGGIEGRVYYNISSWQKLLYQFPFGKKMSLQITDKLGMEDAEFEIPEIKSSFFDYIKLFYNLSVSFIGFNKLKKKYVKNFEKVYSEYNKIDFNLKNHSELLKIYFELDKKLGNNWTAPMVNGFFAMGLLVLLKRSIRKSKIGTKYPNFTNDVLFSQGDVISVAIVKELQEIINIINQNKELASLFKNNKSDYIYNELSVNQKHLKRKIDIYIEKYGERSEQGELKIETINYKEDPLTFISFLKLNTFYSKKKEKNIEKEYFDYKKILKKELKFRLLKRFFLTRIIKYTILRVKDRENLRFIRTKTFALVRKIFRAIDRDLLKNNSIENKSDSLYLNLDEILNPKKTQAYKKIIKERKAKYVDYKKVKPAHRYHQTENGFISVPKLTGKFVSGKIKGIGCSSGNITAEIKLVNIDFSFNEDYSDYILIAEHFEPGWINLFATARGLISERGSLLSHTAILSRELGIPAIVGTKGILSYVKAGDIVEMNGSTGEINILKDEK